MGVDIAKTARAGANAMTTAEQKAHDLLTQAGAHGELSSSLALEDT